MGEVLGREVPGAAPLTREQGLAMLTGRLGGLGFPYDPRTPDRLWTYHTLLCQWNEHMNLTGETDFDTALDRLYMDSLAPLAIPGLFPQGATLVDVGSGAGFPGLPLAIARPDLEVLLLDSQAKRIAFLDAVIEALGLPNVRTLHSRAEDAGQNAELRESFDVAVARAVAPLNVLCELLLPLVRVGGQMICYKGPSAGEEWEAGNRAARLLGGGPLSSHPVTLPSQPEWRHQAVACEKNQKTLRQYPRKAGLPGRKPLGETDKG